MISSSPTDIQPVFDTIARNAVTALRAACMPMFSGSTASRLHFVSNHNALPKPVEIMRRLYRDAPGRLPSFRQSHSDQVQLLTWTMRLRDPDYDHRFPICWRLAANC